MKPAELGKLLKFASAEERTELLALIGTDKLNVPWRPLPGPQTMAYNSEANVLGYGGGGGGGKTDVAIGKGINKHRKVGYFRREGTELESVFDRMEEILGTRAGFNGQSRVWRGAGPRKVQFDFGSVPSPGDERKYRGRPKDLLVIDEAGEWLEGPVRFLMGWVRSVWPDQLCQSLLCFNPPTRAECRWIVDYFAPWLDVSHPLPAWPGELRWFAMMAGHKAETEVPTGDQFMHKGELVIPQSRTFIPALVVDNPFLYGTGYMAQLQALPEPLRSQMLYGDMSAGTEDDAMQIIPTAWIDIAMARWRKKDVKPVMDSMGCDPARGGADRTVLARRHAGMWFDEPLIYPGKSTPDGQSVVAVCVVHLRDRAVIHIDVDGIGASPYDLLNEAGFQVVGLKNATSTPGELDKSGMLKFSNLRSLMWWRMREALDPNANNGIALPPDKQLREELRMPRWWLQGKTIYVESREDLLDPKRLGKSPDVASAYVYSLRETPKIKALTALQREANSATDYNPFDAGILRQ
jgi:hypothetical protein